jgi:parallel beta-helix repeat protein
MSRLSLKFASSIALVVIVVSISSAAFKVQTVEASGTIYIRADGSVEGTDKIVSSDNITYTFNDNINDSIIVERDNIVVDGAGYALQGTGAEYSKGIYLSYRSNVTIKKINVINFDIGTYLYKSYNNSIVGNNITANNVFYGDGIYLDESSNNGIVGNHIANNKYGILLWESLNNTVSGNNITANKGLGMGFGIGLHVSSTYNSIVGNHIANNWRGINLYESSNYNSISENNITANNECGIQIYESSSNNHVYHNNFVDNVKQAIAITYTSVWDDGYPSGGNYWSDYTGIDLNHDGIGDTEYVIDADNIDHYPLMGMFSSFNTSLGYHVDVVSNSTVEYFEYFESNSTIKMYVSGEEGFGFCRVSIPHVLMNVSSISVIIDDGLTPVLYPNYTLYDNGTHRWIYFAYQHSIHEIDITPEFPSFLILPLFMIATLLAVVIYRKRTVKIERLD